MLKIGKSSEKSSVCGFQGTKFMLYFLSACFWGMEARPHGQAVKTSPFHGGNTSSNLVGVIQSLGTLLEL